MPPLRAPAALPQRCPLLVARASTTASLLAPSTSSSSSPSCSARRALSTSAALARQKPSHLTVPRDLVPPYPYGPFRTFKQRNEGLFGGASIQFGNSHAPLHGPLKHGAKSPAVWRPNRHTRRLWSPALGAYLRVRATARVVKTVDAAGGIDEYLLGGKARRVRDLGPAGWALRWKVMQSPAVQARFAAERAALGLPPREGEGEDRTIEETVAAATTGEESQQQQPPLDAEKIDAMIAREDEFDLGGVEVLEEVVEKHPRGAEEVKP
ncbi:hypothetical protein GGR56DRAFT_668642 [Xylariaceae sp. FL0804]|nr:hypothetical protein GGR56DRAFT_668642 [Xylariaceae sp. FL0804]